MSVEPIIGRYLTVTIQGAPHPRPAAVGQRYGGCSGLTAAL